MHLHRLGEANRLTHEALEAGTQGQMLAFEFLRITLANLALIRLQVTLVSAPAISEVARDPTGSSNAFNSRKILSLRRPNT